MRQAIPAERLQSAREDGAGVGLILDEQDGPGSCAAGSFGAVGDHRWRSYPSGRSKCKPELRAPRLGGCAGQIAAGGLDKSASDDETQAGAVPTREKWREKSRLKLLRDPRAVVLDEELHNAVPALGAQRDRASGAPRLKGVQRVGCHVLDRRAHCVRLALDGEAARALDVQKGLRLADRRFESLAHDLERARQVHRLTLRFQPAVSCTGQDRKSTRLNSSHVSISYAVF